MSQEQPIQERYNDLIRVLNEHTVEYEYSIEKVNENNHKILLVDKTFIQVILKPDTEEGCILFQGMAILFCTFNKPFVDALMETLQSISSSKSSG